MSSAVLWTKETEPLGAWGGDCFLPSGSGTGVCSSTWLGIPCAKKYFNGEADESLFLNEAGISFHLNHPHVVNFFCCGNGLDKRNRFIAMELMDVSLSDLISLQAKKKIPFSHAVAVHLILQIARVMCYLHGMGVAHRDLKPHDVVVNKLASSPHLEKHYSVKLVDFGMSKTKVQASKSISMSTPGIGTTVYRAPEVHPKALESNGKGKAIWFKADVYSFGITCAQILSLKPPFTDTRRGEFYKELIRGQRPVLPADSPKELVALLKDCWDTSPRSRPRFLEICTRLEIIKHNLLRGVSTADRSFQEVRIDSTSYQFIQRKVEEHAAMQIHHVANTDEEPNTKISRFRLNHLLSPSRSSSPGASDNSPESSFRLGFNSSDGTSGRYSDTRSNRETGSQDSVLLRTQSGANLPVPSSARKNPRAASGSKLANMVSGSSLPSESSKEANGVAILQSASSSLSERRSQRLGNLVPSRRVYTEVGREKVLALGRVEGSARVVTSLGEADTNGCDTGLRQQEGSREPGTKWEVEYEPGVYMRLTALRGGGNDLRRALFSRNLSKEHVQ